MKKLFSLLLALALVLGLAACSGSGSKPAGETPASEAQSAAEDTPAAPAEPKILKLAESFAYASLDAHKDWNGW